MADQKDQPGPAGNLAADDALRIAMLSLESSTDGVCWFDANMAVVYANEAACQTLGYALDEFLTLSISDLNPTCSSDAMARSGSTATGPSAAAGFPPWTQALLVGTSAQSYETINRHKDGRLLPVTVSAAPIDLAGRRYIVAVTRDVSSRRWMESALQTTEEALRRAKEDADTASLAKTEFLHRMSHELRTPLNAIVGMSHLALTTDLTPPQRDYISKVHGAAQDLAALVASALEHSELAPPRPPRPAPAAKPGAAQTAGPAADAAVHVLVVEDNRLNQRVAREMLELCLTAGRRSGASERRPLGLIARVPLIAAAETPFMLPIVTSSVPALQPDTLKASPA